MLGTSGLERRWEVPECTSPGVGPREGRTSAPGHTSGREGMLSSFSTGNSPKSQVAPTAEAWTRVPRPLSAPGLPATELISLTAVGPLRRPPLPYLPPPDPQGLRAESRGGWEGIQPKRRVLLPPHSPLSFPGRWSPRPSSACIVQAPFRLAVTSPSCLMATSEVRPDTLGTRLVSASPSLLGGGAAWLLAQRGPGLASSFCQMLDEHLPLPL